MPSSGSDRHLPCRVVNFALSRESEKHERGGGWWWLAKPWTQRVTLMRREESLQRGQSEALHMGVELGRSLSQPVELWEVVLVS